MRVLTTDDLGNLVREQRLHLRMSQAELAERAGLDRSWLSHVERGHDRAEFGKVLRVLIALDVVLDLRRSMLDGPENWHDERDSGLADDPLDLNEYLTQFDNPKGAGRG
jgi:transcriptional regulator with XRE-family HTH domain